MAVVGSRLWGLARSGSDWDLFIVVSSSRARSCVSLARQGGAGKGGVSADYLATLEAAHEAYFAECDHAKARVDATASPDDVAARVLAAIDAAIADLAVADDENAADAAALPPPAPKPSRAISPTSVAADVAALGDAP